VCIVYYLMLERKIKYKIRRRKEEDEGKKKKK
jgi:hypothetical protein